MHELSKEAARDMVASYLTFGGMFLLGLFLMVVFPIQRNGCGGKILVPWFMVVIPCLAWREAKDLDAFVLQSYWHLAPGFWSGLRKLCEFVLVLAVNSALFIGWGTFLENLYKAQQRRHSAAEEKT